MVQIVTLNICLQMMYYRGHYPRHSKVYRNLLSDYEKIQKERISAFKEFKKDTEDRIMIQS